MAERVKFMEEVSKSPNSLITLIVVVIIYLSAHYAISYLTIFVFESVFFDIGNELLLATILSLLRFGWRF